MVASEVGDAVSSAEEDVRETSEVASSNLQEVIATRRTQHEFPVIRPDELTRDDDRAFAREQLAFLRKSEQEEVQAYLEEQFVDQYRSNLDEGDLPEEESYAQWCGVSYYPLMRAFYVKKSFDARKCDHRWHSERFRPLLAVVSIRDSYERCRVERLCDRMKEADVENFTEALEQRWATVAQKSLSSNKLARFEMFLEEDYYVTMQEVIRHREDEVSKQEEHEAQVQALAVAAWEQEKVRSAYVPKDPPPDFVEKHRARFEAQILADPPEEFTGSSRVRFDNSIPSARSLVSSTQTLPWGPHVGRSPSRGTATVLKVEPGCGVGEQERHTREQLLRQLHSRENKKKKKKKKKKK